MKHLFRIFFILLLFGTPIIYADTVTYLDKSLTLVPPKGYCQLGSSSVETEILQIHRENISSAGELAQLVVPCDELEAFKTGKIQGFSRWAQTLVLKPKGQLRLVQEPRSVFIRSLARSFVDKPIDINELNNRVHELLAQTDSSINTSGIEPLGANSDAFFLLMRAIIKIGTVTNTVTVLAATTTVNQLPIGIYLYATSEARNSPLAATLQSYIHSVLDKNK